MRLSGWTWTPNARNAGGQIRRTSAPARLVLHTTEAPAADLRRMAERHEWPPHLWADPFAPHLKFQTVPLGRSAYALAASSGGETNHMGRCVQIELHGRAADTPHWPDLVLATIGQWVEQICAAEGIPLVAYQPNVDSRGYGTGAAQRMTWAQWSSFSGVCAHQHVPGNSHWDAGAIDLPRVLEWARYWRTANQPGGTPMAGEADLFLSDAKSDWRGAAAILTTNHHVSTEIAPQVRQILRLVQGLPTDRPATVAEVVQAAEDTIDAIVGALDGLEIVGREPGDGTAARKLLAELIGATLP